MLKHEFVTNVIEKTFVYTDKEGLRTNLSKLASAGENDPECHCIAKYKDGQDKPVVEVKFYGEEKKLLQEWVNL